MLWGGKNMFFWGSCFFDVFLVNLSQGKDPVYFTVIIMVESRTK